MRAEEQVQCWWRCRTPINSKVSAVPLPFEAAMVIDGKWRVRRCSAPQRRRAAGAPSPSSGEECISSKIPAQTRSAGNGTEWDGTPADAVSDIARPLCHAVQPRASLLIAAQIVTRMPPWPRRARWGFKRRVECNESAGPSMRAGGASSGTRAVPVLHHGDNRQIQASRRGHRVQEQCACSTCWRRRCRPQRSSTRSGWRRGESKPSGGIARHRIIIYTTGGGSWCRSSMSS